MGTGRSAGAFRHGWRTAACIAGTLLAGAGSLAAAQPPPLGQWTSPAGNVLIVQDNATCLYITKTLRAQGSCSWKPGPPEGILTIVYQAQNRLQRLDVSVRWVRPDRIVVLGEPFQLH